MTAHLERLVAPAALVAGAALLGTTVARETQIYFITALLAVTLVVALYVFANLMLSMHLYHGAFSMLQSIGFNHPRYNQRLKLVARGLAFLVTAGNVFLPLTVLLGLVK